MANTAVGQGAQPRLDYNDLLKLLKSKRLDSVYRDFMELANAPEDLKCLLIVADNLRRVFKKLRAWRQVPPFAGWPRLMSFLHVHARKIEQQFGQVVNPPPTANNQSATGWLKDIFRGEFEDFPIYIMLCCSHRGREVRYGALQLQMLYARWAELNAAKNDNVTPIPLRPRRGKSVTGTRITRHPKDYMRAVRDLSGPDFAPLLDHLEPENLPGIFVQSRQVVLPAGRDFPSRYRRIMNYCRHHSGARQGISSSKSGSRGPRRPSYPEYVVYTDTRFGIRFESENEPEGETSIGQQTVEERTISEAMALELGLDPQELGRGPIDILNDVPGAASHEEALQTARARTRSWEIDKTLFGWNAQALRISEIQANLFAALCEARDDKAIPGEDLTAAAVVAVAIDTGRDLDKILKLKIEDMPETEFAFQPPTKQEPNAWWSWHTIGPLYKSELDTPPAKSEYRADQLRFRATPLVRDLLLKHMKRQKIRSNNGFRNEKTGEWVKDWISRYDPEKRITLNRLSHLRANELNRITGGERACSCLILGIPQTPAAVELHYTVLGTREATRLFEDSSRGIWGSQYVPGSSPRSELNQDTYCGCRAFPTRDAVKATVRWLRNGSRHFFRISVDEFNAQRNRQYLNRAVLYLVWHQFYAFGTRAICDAYQEKDVFAEGTLVGILSDKDFVDRYKTRIIWADRILRDHMTAVEDRLAEIAQKLRIRSVLPESSVWFLDDDLKPIPITPTHISAVLGTKFPFPVNTPRKVMRNLLRERGVSHEHAEAYMGHWSHGREPWSPYSSFDFDRFLKMLKATIPGCLRELGFSRLPKAGAV